MASMSNFLFEARNKKTREVVKVDALDDYFGSHRYGYRAEDHSNGIMSQDEFDSLYEEFPKKDKMKKSDTKVKKARRGKRLGDSSGNANVTVIRALQEIFEDKTLKQVITSLSRWSARITGGRGSQILYTCSADGVTAQGKGWQLRIDDISALNTERIEWLNLKRRIARLIRLNDGKK